MGVGVKGALPFCVQNNNIEQKQRKLCMCSHACVIWNHTPTVSQHKSHYHMDLRTVARMARGRWIRGWREDGLQMII